MSGARSQVPRMLALVPYLRERGAVPVEQVARDFGVSAQQIVKDLNVLWFCGLPESVTGEMIDVDMDALEADGTVRVDNTDFLARPLRLTTAEALSLIVALGTLRETATPDELPSLESALSKLEAATGHGAEDDPERDQAVLVQIERPDEEVHLAVRRALGDGRRLHLVYLVAARDEQTERDVDPLRLVTDQGRPYLEGWCHRAEGVRLFRLDRVVSAEVLAARADRHDDLARRDLSAGLFLPSGDALVAVLELDRPARWIAEYHPVDDSEELEDGVLRVTMRVADPEWLRRLVLRQGGAARVVSPSELATEVADRAVAALDAYGRDVGAWQSNT